MKKAMILSLVIALSLFTFSAFAADKAPAKAKDKAEKAAKAPGDAEAIQKVLDQWKAAAVANDITKALALYSEKFTSAEYGDKAGLKKFLDDAMGSGMLKNAEVDMAKSKTEIKKDKGTATAGPIELKASFGSATINLDLAKEGANWMIKGMEVQEH
jgi:hypothetical protein